MVISPPVTSPKPKVISPHNRITSPHTKVTSPHTEVTSDRIPFSSLLFSSSSPLPLSNIYSPSTCQIDTILKAYIHFNSYMKRIRVEESHRTKWISYMERSNFCMGRSDFCMVRSDFDYGAKWRLVGGEMTGYRCKQLPAPYKTTYPRRKRNRQTDC